MSKKIRPDQVTFVYPELDHEKMLHLYGSAVAAGFPSPADDFLEKQIDLNEHLIRNKAASFMVRISGNSMTGAGIYNNDVVIVDRSLEAINGSIVLAVVDGEFTVKRFEKIKNKILLHAENKDYSTIEITEDRDFQVWGIVTYCLHKL